MSKVGSNLTQWCSQEESIFELRLYSRMWSSRSNTLSQITSSSAPPSRYSVSAHWRYLMIWLPLSSIPWLLQWVGWLGSQTSHRTILYNTVELSRNISRLLQPILLVNLWNTRAHDLHSLTHCQFLSLVVSSVDQRVYGNLLVLVANLSKLDKTV